MPLLQPLLNRLREQLKNYFWRHVQAAANGLNQLSRMPINSIMTCLVIGIALALPMAVFVVLKNIETLNQGLQQTNQLTVYLKNDVNANEAETLVRSLKNNPTIRSVTAISPEAGLKELQSQAGLSDVLNELANNPLPWSLVVLPQKTYRTPAQLQELSQHLKAFSQVDNVQMDLAWAAKLKALLHLAHRFFIALAVFLGIGVLLIVNNCIRSVTHANRKEIEIVKFVGGTNAFVRRPFLYVGMVYGLLGGIVAWQLVDFLLIWLRGPVHQVASLYQSPFQLISIGFSQTFFLLISSLLLGWLGAWLAVSRHLRTVSLF